MADTETQIRELFASSNPNITQDVLHELLSITRLLSIDPQELFYKWESYVLKMGTENTKLEYKTVKDFKKDLQDTLERETRSKGQHAAPRKTMAATPRAGVSGGDMFDMLGGVVSTTPRSVGSAKRKAGEAQTPTSKAAKNGIHSSPTPIPTRDVDVWELVCVFLSSLRMVLATISSPERLSLCVVRTSAVNTLRCRKLCLYRSYRLQHRLLQNLRSTMSVLRMASGEMRPLSYIIAGGPYTPETDLSFGAFHSLLSQAATQHPDVLIMTGPFLDLEHPLLASGDLEDHLPPGTKLNPDTATLLDVFKALIAAPIQRLVQSHPTITIVLVPSLRDAVSKHVSFPQDRLHRPSLGLPKQCQIVTNPVTLSFNEVVFGIGSQDILSELRRENVYAPGKSGASFNEDLLARLSGHLIDQRHYFPVFPAQDEESEAEVLGHNVFERARVERHENMNTTRACITSNITIMHNKHNALLCNVHTTFLVFATIGRLRLDLPAIAGLSAAKPSRYPSHGACLVLITAWEALVAFDACPELANAKRDYGRLYLLH
ncbi:hypothetical protein L1887_63004 [Cichorium endivia]|nr:hypothetical protein L1887_63004 [Cichorium endivia]